MMVAWCLPFQLFTPILLNAFHFGTLWSCRAVNNDVSNISHSGLRCGASHHAGPWLLCLLGWRIIVGLTCLMPSCKAPVLGLDLEDTLDKVGSQGAYHRSQNDNDDGVN